MPSTLNRAVSLPEPARHGVRAVLSIPNWTNRHAQTSKARLRAVPAALNWMDGKNSKVGTIHAPCLAGSGGWMARFWAMALPTNRASGFRQMDNPVRAKALCHADRQSRSGRRGLTTLRALLVRVDRLSGSGPMAWPVHRTLRVRADRRSCSRRSWADGWSN